MKLQDLQDYVLTQQNEGLTKITVDISEDPDGIASGFFVNKTKGTYVYETEEEADVMINRARQDAGFIGCDKKFKAGKMNKAGEIVKPDSWIVVIKRNH